MMEQIRLRLQKLKDLQAKKHEEYLAAKREVEQKQRDSFDLIWQIEQTKERLMTSFSH